LLVGALFFQSLRGYLFGVLLLRLFCHWFLSGKPTWLLVEP
jgi:hypothetical protein